MAEFPAMPLWTDAYLGDTTHLSTFEHGAYLLLLIVSWRSAGGRIPDDDALLARYSKMTRDKWRKVRPILEPFFRIERGFWTQARLQDELRHLQSRRKSQSEAGIASAAAKALKRLHRGSTDVASTLQRNGNDSPTPIPIPNNIEEKSSIVVARGPFGRRKPKKPIPHDWLPLEPGPTGAAAMIERNWSAERREREIETFKAHHGSRANVMANWQQAWQNWVLNSEKFNRGNGNGNRTDTGKSEAAFAMLNPSDDKPF